MFFNTLDKWMMGDDSDDLTDGKFHELTVSTRRQVFIFLSLGPQVQAAGENCLMLLESWPPLPPLHAGVGASSS